MILRPEYSLRGYQPQGVRFLRTRKSAILGFHTGQGKSYTLLAAIDLAYETWGKKRPIVLFAPKRATQLVWPEQIEKFTTATWVDFEDLRDTYQIGGPREQLDPYDIIIVRYSRSRSNVEMLRDICKGRIVCFDEIHRMKNPEAEQTRSTREITKHSPVKWGLSATTVLNSPFDLWGVLSFLDPSIFGDRFAFQSNFCVMRKQYVRHHGRRRQIQVVHDYKNLDELKKIREGYILTVEADVKVTYHKHTYGWTEEEEIHYLQAASGMAHFDNRGFAQRMPDLQRVVDGSMDKTGEPREDFRSSKYRSFLSTIREFIDSGESCLVYTDYYASMDMLNTLLQEDLPGVQICCISGRGTELPTEFPCVVITTASGSESLNLQFANRVLFYDLPFSVGTIIQMVGRITRMDSKYIDNLHAHVWDNEDNIDHYKWMLLEAHTDVINQILGSSGNLPKSESAVRKSLVADMRKELLWRTKERIKD